MRDDKTSDSSLVKWGVIGSIGAAVSFLSEGALGLAVTGTTKNKHPINWKRNVLLGGAAGLAGSVGLDVWNKSKQEKENIKNDQTEQYWQKWVEENCPDKSESLQR